MTNHVTAFDAAAANAPREHDPRVAREAVASNAAVSGQAPVRPRLITCLGELLVDFLPVVEDSRTVGFRLHAGGSPLNVAVAAARLGGQVALAGKVGTDFFGRFLREHVVAEGIDDRWLMDVAAAPTTLAFVATSQGEPQFTFYGDGAADTLLEPGELPAALFDDTAILHVGSISLLRGTTPEAIRSACHRLQGEALLSLDPNVRPGMVTDEGAYRRLLDDLYGLVDVVRISVADLAWLEPGLDAEAGARAILARGPALVVVTRGAEGIVAARNGPDGATIVRVHAVRVPVADTVGAGDSFNAGLLVRLVELDAATHPGIARLSDADLEAALRFASSVAAINCTRAGADPPDRAAVEAFLATRAATKEN